MGILSKIREAATILLVRPSEARNALEVFMVKRPGRGDFPDLHVYPGGKVDKSDLNPEIRSHIVSETEISDEELS